MTEAQSQKQGWADDSEEDAWNDDTECRIDRCLRILTENADAVQILVSSDRGPAGTFMVIKGAGNWYARVGMARAMIVRDDEDTRMRAHD